MSSDYIIRDYNSDDFFSLLYLVMKHGKAELMTCDNPLRRLASMLQKPGYQAAENLLIAEAQGDIIGYINTVPEPGIDRVILDYLFAPEYMSGAMPRQLFTRALKRAVKSGVKYIHVEVDTGNTPVNDLVAHQGFHEVTRYCVLQIDVSEKEVEPGNRDDAVVCCMGEGDGELLVEIQNKCFADHWGYEPVNSESITWWLDFWQNSSEDILFAWDGDKVVGYCWTVEKYGSEPSTGKRMGCIFMLGVDDNYRTTGLGRRLLSEGLDLLKRRGCEVVTITVDSRNTTALNLYKSTGFSITAETVWYQKDIS
jgi:mycothiol synthase